MICSLTLPGGEIVEGSGPVIVIGPNGSGKTRQSRQISSDSNIEFINALRNTRVAPELPAMGVDSARNNFEAQKSQSRLQHWEIASDFDYMLSQLLAQQSMAAIDFTTRFRKDAASAGVPPTTPLTRVEEVWGEVFHGRELAWRDWKPLIRSSTSGAVVEYLGNQMSDGEKSVLYLASRVFSSPPGVLLIDEPETHLHSLLAVRLWDALEAARPDTRFVYITHDLTFALSRRGAQFVLASPTAGLRSIELGRDLPGDVAEALLGSASLSFYASRIMFCEGEQGSYDERLYNAWFSGPDTVVRPVGGCQKVLRCVEAVNSSGFTSGLTAAGIVDRDFLPDEFIENLPSGVSALDVHEIESLLSLPAVVKAACDHIGRTFDEASYLAALRSTTSASQSEGVATRRWRRRLEPKLEGLLAGTSKAHDSLVALRAAIPLIFDHKRWSFDPAAILNEESARVQSAVNGTDVVDFLRIFPGKQCLPMAARTAGLAVDAYVDLICRSLSSQGADVSRLTGGLEDALSPYLPPRYAAVTPR